MSDPRRALPGVDALLAEPAFAELLASRPRARIVRAVRAELAGVRDALARDAASAPASPEVWARAVGARLDDDDVPSLRRTINATGVVLHTNLGRAPLAEAAVEAMREAAAYANLEYDLQAGTRGSRYDHCVELLVELTGAEDALVVNNCAAALVLALNTVAEGRGVAVSRGELVEIGGGFRVPEIMERSGARLVEVGSTNRTRAADYEEALQRGDVAALLKVHRSNFRISGFTEEVALDALVTVGGEHGVPVLHDLGSGLLADPERLGLPYEPRASESLSAGAALVVFSGDKLLGGPQAGIVVGKAREVGRARANPLCRALRVDKTTLAALEATLRLYRDPEGALEAVPVLRMLSTPLPALQVRAEALAGGIVERLGEPDAVDVLVAPGEGRVGGGTYPGVTLPSVTVCIRAEEGADTLAARLRDGAPPVVGRVEEGALVLDLRTVEPEMDIVLARRVAEAAGPGRGR